MRVFESTINQRREGGIMAAPQFGRTDTRRRKGTAPVVTAVKVAAHAGIHTHLKVDIFLGMAKDEEDSVSLEAFAIANGIGHVSVVKRKIKDRRRKEKHDRHDQNVKMRAEVQSATAKSHCGGGKKN